jgi:hypothetical protein
MGPYGWGMQVVKVGGGTQTRKDDAKCMCVTETEHQMPVGPLGPGVSSALVL